MSFAVVVASRNETEGPNFHIWNTVIDNIKILATGWLALFPMTARQCLPNHVLKDLPVSPI
jgi:hypothetical protein